MIVAGGGQRGKMSYNTTYNVCSRWNGKVLIILYCWRGLSLESSSLARGRPSPPLFTGYLLQICSAESFGIR
jgi:hypothetical protein